MSEENVVQHHEVEIITVKLFKELLADVVAKFEELNEDSEVLFVIGEPSDERRVLPVAIGRADLNSPEGETMSGIMVILQIHPIAKQLMEKKFAAAGLVPALNDADGTKIIVPGEEGNA